MAFVNPLDALGFSPDAPEPTYDQLRNAKRRRVLDFQLGETIEVCGVEVSKADFERCTSGLDDPSVLTGYRALQRHPSLGRFLAMGDTAYFHSPQNPPPEDATAIISVAGGDYANSFGRALAKAVRQHDVELVKAMTQAAPLYGSRVRADAERPTADLLAEAEQELASMAAQMRAGSLQPQEAAIDAAFEVRPDVLNALPESFATSRAQVARSMRALGVTAINDGDDPESSFKLLSLAAAFDTSDSIQQDISKQLDIVRRRRDERRLSEAYATELATVATTLVRLGELMDAADAGDPVRLASISDENLIPVELLNSLPADLSNARDQIGFALRELSVAIWNKMGDVWPVPLRFSTAVGLLDKAMEINVGGDASTALLDDRITLTRLEGERRKADKNDVAVLGGILLNIRKKTGHLKGYQTNWTAVSSMLSDLLTADVARLLANVYSYSPDDVVGVIKLAQPYLAGLQKYAKNNFNAAVRRLQPLTAVSPAIAAMVSPAGLTQAASSNPDVQRATSDKQIWEYPIFWWGMLFLVFWLLSLGS